MVLPRLRLVLHILVQLLYLFAHGPYLPYSNNPCPSFTEEH
uniref:Uncharacterized protein n=1 Tax=Heterorhabditis bacteriophora TaxID=37862 RepID=A0A1I7WBR6_HETBA